MNISCIVICNVRFCSTYVSTITFVIFPSVGTKHAVHKSPLEIHKFFLQNGRVLCCVGRVDMTMVNVAMML